MNSASTVPDWLSRRAATSPHRVAVTSGDVTWSFAELDRRSRQTARRLATLGIAAGDRVAVLMTNDLAYPATLHGISKLGAVAVPLNVRLAQAELVWQVRHSNSALLLCNEVMREQAAQVAATSGVPWVQAAGGQPGTEPASGVPTLEQVEESAVTLACDIDLGRVHTILYTSGTTGRPKGTMLTYGNHWWSAVASALNLGQQHSDCWLACMPFFHAGGLAVLMRSIIYGMPVLLHDGFDPQRVNRAIDRDGVTIVSVVSNMLSRMLDARGDKPYPKTLRCVLLGGGPVPRALLQRSAALGIPVIQTYGLTETASQVATLSPADALRKLGSAGQALLPFEIRIVPPGGSPLAASSTGASVVGEIAVRGPNVMKGYLDDESATHAALREGWLYTGDIGYLDEEGFLFVLDRRDDLIISGGENVYPAEVEAALLAHPAVGEAAVVGADDARWGQVPVAFVVLRSDQRVGTEELVEHCAQRLARYKVPVKVAFVSQLPRNAAGKLMRHRLRGQEV